MGAKVLVVDGVGGFPNAAKRRGKCQRGTQNKVLPLKYEKGVLLELDENGKPKE